jgi:hypothetical protein
MRPGRETAVLTVAAIRSPRGERSARILFNERQQIFTPSAAEAQVPDRLVAALESSRPVKAVLDPRRGTLQRIADPSTIELDEFERSRTLLEKPDRTVRVDVSSIDPTRFDVVDLHLKARTFGLCKRIVPNYRKAKEIFDFCAQQSCHLPGPTAVTPCIPFQYVIDGCYARAHKMRKIITEQFGYCCEKVFSFAIDDDDELAVKAGKWGGCCVTWWYHVAPLIRVRTKIFDLKLVLAMVIDPGMFDHPVPVSTWLMAQENATCSPTAKVSKYSIQPGSAYTPANGQGTAFTTDPSYTATNTTLNNYKNLTTCP